jgi:hypothetical protein
LPAGPPATARRGRRSIASHSHVPTAAAPARSGFLARADVPSRGAASLRASVPLRADAPSRAEAPLRGAPPLRASALAGPRPPLASPEPRRVSAVSRPRPSSTRSARSRRSARVGLVAGKESGIRLWATRSWSERLANAFTRAAGPGAGGSEIPPREKGGSLALPS